MQENRHLDLILPDVWKMLCSWFSMQEFLHGQLIIEYPMIGFLAMGYFLCTL